MLRQPSIADALMFNIYPSPFLNCNIDFILRKLIATAVSTLTFLYFLPQTEHLSRTLIVSNDVTILAALVKNPLFLLVPNIQAVLLHIRNPDSHSNIFQLENLQ